MTQTYIMLLVGQIRLLICILSLCRLGKSGGETNAPEYIIWPMDGLTTIGVDDATDFIRSMTSEKIGFYSSYRRSFNAEPVLIYSLARLVPNAVRQVQEHNAVYMPFEKAGHH